MPNTDPSQMGGSSPAAPEPVQAEPVVEIKSPPAEVSVIPAAEEPSSGDPGKKFITDPFKIAPKSAPSPASDPEENDPADPKAPRSEPGSKEDNIVRLRKSYEESNRKVKSFESQVSNLNKELEALRKQPKTADNQADIAELTAEREALKQARTEAETLRKQLDENKKSLARTDIRNSDEFLKEQKKLSESAGRAQAVIESVAQEHGITAKLAQLIKEARETPENRPVYNSIIMALRDSQNPAAEEHLKSQIKAVMKSQEKMHEIEASGLQAKEAWETNRKGEFSRSIEETRSQLGQKFPLYNKNSQEWMALPQESKEAITAFEDNAFQAAEIAVNAAADPKKLAAMAYQTQLSLQIANASHQNAAAVIEKLNGEHAAYRDTSEKEITSLRSRLSNYEKVSARTPGSVGSPTPTSSSGAVKVITDPSKMKNFF